MSVAMMPGPHFVDRNAIGREADGKQFRRHRQPRLAHTVLAAMRRRHFGRHRRDEHDRARSAVAACCCTNSRATACVRKYGPCRLVRSTSSKLSSVAASRSARTRGARPALFTSACSVAEMRDDRRQQLRPVVRASDVGGPVLGPAAERRQLLHDVRDLLRASEDRTGRASSRRARARARCRARCRACRR